jgi:hypothetical protein
VLGEVVDRALERELMASPFIRPRGQPPDKKKDSIRRDLVLVVSGVVTAGVLLGCVLVGVLLSQVLERTEGDGTPAATATSSPTGSPTMTSMPVPPTSMPVKATSTQSQPIPPSWTPTVEPALPRLPNTGTGP